MGGGGGRQGDLMNLFLNKEIRLNMPLISIDLSLNAVIMQVKYNVLYYGPFVIVSVLSELACWNCVRRTKR
jgi:hypothetical protein